jgi:CubicO group peptidase (beta-lactamase class C family)
VKLRACCSLRRLAGFGVGLVLAGVVAFLVAFGRIAAGYAATITALQVFGSGDELARVRAERLQLPLGLGSALAIEVEERDGVREARATFLGLIERRARWRPGLGASRLADETFAPAEVPDLVPPNPTDVPWPRGDALELAPLEPARAANLERAIEHAFTDPETGQTRGTHAVAVVRGGELVAERYREGYDLHTPILGWSMTKSVTATLFARLLLLGKIASVDEPAAVSEWQIEGDPRHSITYAQLLCMTSGLAFFANYELPWSDSLRMLFASADVAAYAANQPLAHAPGTVWSYSDGTSNILARCVREVCAEDENERRLFPQRALFAPLHMSTAVISVDARGNWVGSSLMQASARDWLRLGWLYASDGVVDGERLVPAGWVDFVSRATAGSPERSYGAHFWRYDRELGRTSKGRAVPALLADVFYASGHDGQFLWIDRTRGIVLVRLGAAGPAGAAPFDPEAFAEEVFAALLGPG